MSKNYITLYSKNKDSAITYEDVENISIHDRYIQFRCAKQEIFTNTEFIYVTDNTTQ